MIPGPSELLIIFGVAVLLFGPSKLPQLGSAIGESIRNFKKGMKPNEGPETPQQPQGPQPLIAQQAPTQQTPQAVIVEPAKTE
jgi:sec-independent protein translocase protein TatA